MDTARKTIFAILFVVGLGAIAALPACSESEEPDSAEEALENAGDAAEDAMDDAEEAAEDAIDGE